eukprot:scaffold163707_cov49-Attheya_sp.AAC.4
MYYGEHPAHHATVMNLAPSPTKAMDIVTTPGARDIAENVATLMGVDPLAQGNQSQHGGTQKTSAEVESQRNWDTARTLLMLEGARIVTNPHNGAAEVAYPTITEDWAELYSNAHVAQLSPAFSGLLEAACDDRDSSVHYLNKSIKMPEFSQLAAKSLTQVITKRSSLDDTTFFKSNEISILTLLRAPEHNTEYNNYCTAKYTTEIEHLVGQTEKQQTKVGTEIFSAAASKNTPTTTSSQQSQTGTSSPTSSTVSTTTTKNKYRCSTSTSASWETSGAPEPSGPGTT